MKTVTDTVPFQRCSMCRAKCVASELTGGLCESCDQEQAMEAMLENPSVAFAF